MLSNIIADIICEEFDKKFRETMTSGKESSHGMLIRFRLDDDALSVIKHNSTLDDTRYPERELLLWCRYGNYIAVLTRDTVKHPDESSQWYLLSMHDSCWREDGVRRFMRRFEEDLDGLNSEWYEVVEIPDEVREVVNSRNDRVLYPLM